jgi:hypothetical protein
MLTDAERQERIDAARAEAARLRADPATPRRAYWLSFAAETFLGGCLVDGVVNPADAIEQSHRLGINPGGEVLMAEIPLDKIPKNYPRNTLLNKDQLTALGGWAKMEEDDVAGYRSPTNNQSP